MNTQIIGRDKEQKRLQELYDSGNPEFIALYGRRRVGKNSDPAAQIDLLIDRKDEVINLCEMKFSNTQYAITKDYEENLRNKMAVYRAETKTNKALHLTLLTTLGIAKNKYAEIVQKELLLNDLFR